MLAGPIPGSLEILAELRGHGTPLYSLTNWSAETYAPARERFAFLSWFQGILVSGEVGVIKPDPRIFELLIERFAISPEHSVYIDDVEKNTVAARPFGFHAIHFTTPPRCGGSLSNSSSFACPMRSRRQQPVRPRNMVLGSASEPGRQGVVTWNSAAAPITAAIG
jgi:2-haloacid dehalogenase